MRAMTCWPLALTLAVWGCDDGAPAATDPAVDGGVSDAVGPDAATPDAGPAAPIDAGWIIDAEVPLGAPEPLPAPPTITSVQSGRFATSMVCAQCHASTTAASAMRDSQGDAIAPFDLWRSSMMANSARDPLWRAAMSAEVAATPLAQEYIEGTCLSCHAPAGARVATHTDARMLEGRGAAAQIAWDGANCTTCHQIAPDNFGTDASFTGQWEIHPERRIFGPHRDPIPGPMLNHTDYRPTYGAHVLDSALCGTCHVLETTTLTANARPTGHTLVEQATYLEWRNSAYPDDEVSCQACHMPQTDAHGVPTRTVIARSPPGGDFRGLEARQPFGRHLLVGGNTLVPQMLRDFPDQLSPLAPAAAFDATIEAARDNLTTAAGLEIGAPTATEDGIVVPITVQNLAGHKLPTGFPSRRAWLRVTAWDAAGAVVFDSGAYNEAGQIVQGRQVAPFERHSGPTEPHRQRVSNDRQVQIYAAQMCDAEGQPTWRLLRGATFCQDDRLLPVGWTETHRDAARTLPAGLGDDPDFVAGRDTTEYLLPAASARVVAVLLHQVLDPRFAEEMFVLDTPEIRALRFYLERVDRRPEVMARASQDL